tara:strand:+ start:60 stop:506 length:447 start_codon:yes stop_codon:yes gene_type:complete
MEETTTTSINEELDASPVTVMDSLHERFPEGKLLNLKEITDFSNIGKQRQVWDSDTNRGKLDENGKKVMEDNYRFGVYDTDGQSIIGYFKFVKPSINWSYIRVKTNHVTGDDGTQYLWFELMNKLDTVADVQNFVKSKALLADISEEL